MPSTPVGIIVDPNGRTSSVTITAASGASVTAYTTKNGVTTHTFPVSVSADTEFWLAERGSYVVSASGDAGADGEGGDLTVDLSGGGTQTVQLGAADDGDPSLGRLERRLVEQLSATDSALLTLSPLELPLDIWPAYAFPGGVSATYAGWLTSIDALLAGEVSSGRVVRTVEGASSDATRSIVSFKAGTGPRVALITGGTHPDEKIAQAAAHQFFMEFATGQAMRALRQRVTVVWVPTVTPSGFLNSRTNANAIDVNRNYPFFHAAYVPPSADRAKGAAPLDQPESQIIKAIIDRERVTCWMDCHNFGPSGDDLQFYAPSPWVSGKRDLVCGAASLWNTLYGPTLTISDLTPNDGAPTGTNWFNYYQRWSKTRPLLDAVSFGLECRSDLLGSDDAALSYSQAAMRAYCGLLLTNLETWLREGTRPSTPVAARVSAARATSSYNGALALNAGGSRIQTENFLSIPWDSIVPSVAGASGTDLKTVCPSPGSWVAVARGYLMQTAATAPRRIDFRWYIDGAYDDRDTLSITVPVSSVRTPFVVRSRQVVTALDAATINTWNLRASQIGVGTNPDVDIVRATVDLVFVPHEPVGAAVPLTN